MEKYLEKYPLIKIALYCYICVMSALASTVAYSKNQTNKIYCAIGIQFESIDELKRDLLLNAKRSAVNELFGEMISATTAVQDFVFTSDQVSSSSAGFVRINGVPKYYNGNNLAETCVEINAYATDSDLKKIAPKILTKKTCSSNSKMTTKELIEHTRNKVYIDAIRDYDSRLSEIQENSLVKLVRKKEIIKEGFIPDTETYCVQARGQISPIEIITLLDFPPKTEPPSPGISGVSEILIQSNVPTVLQISEIVAVDASTGDDLALQSKGAKVIASSLFGRGASELYAIDGDGPSRFPNIYHSKGAGLQEYLRVKLKQPAKLKSVTIMGRADCCSNRDIFNLTLFDDKGEQILRKNNLSAAGSSHSVTIDLMD